MQKRADSVRSMKQASIGTDVPTREKLKMAASAAGVPLSEYLRVLADRETKDLQAGFGIPATTKGHETEISELVRVNQTLVKMVVLLTSATAAGLSKELMESCDDVGEMLAEFQNDIYKSIKEKVVTFKAENKEFQPLFTEN